MRMILKWAVVVAAGAMPLASCGGEDDDRASDEPSLVATTSIWADITANVACGETVASVIPAGADPHTYEPSLRDRELMEGADLVVANGGNLEEVLVDLLDTVSTDVIDMSVGVDLIADDGHDHEDDQDGHVHADGNPHIWHDPTRIADALDLIASALAATDREPASIQRCADAYRAELLAVDAEIVELLDPIPPEARVLVTNHGSLAYFADRYGFEVLGTVLPGDTTLAETNAADLEELADIITARDVTAIFVDESAATADAEALARRVGVDVIALPTGSLTEDGSATTYLELLRSNATTIAEALAP